MKKNKITVFIFLLAVIKLNPARSQLAEIPFKLEESGHVLIAVKIDGTDKTVNFVMDTGATADLLDSKVAEEIGLLPSSTQNVMGAGGVKSYDVVANQNIIIL